MSGTVTEVSGQANYKEFKKLLKRFKTVRLLHNHVYYKLVKEDILDILKYSDDVIHYSYWEERNDVIWIEKITR